MAAVVEETLAALVEIERARREELRRTDWASVARPNQRIPPGDWRIWLVLAGRGWGKTRTGAETVREWSKRFRRIGLIAPTRTDAREVMLDGESGLFRVFPSWERPTYWPSRYRLEFHSGAIGILYTADEPDRLRGPQHEKIWADEVAAWRYPEAWDMAMLGLRLGSSPQIVATTTPKPVPLIRRLWHLAIDGDPQIVVTRGPTHENEANLAPQFVTEIIGRYAGTRLWRQEVEGEVLEEVEGALWTWQMIEATRVKDIPDLERVVLAVDPATTHGEDSDETGVAVAGKGIDGNFCVLRAEGLKLSPEGWGSRVLRLADEFEVDCIVAEVNAGGEMVTSVLRAVSRGRPLPRIRTIHAKRGKVVRAEPVVALYEQGLVKHAAPFPALEDQMTRFPVATDHDDLVDALVYALTELAGGKRRLTAF